MRDHGLFWEQIGELCTGKAVILLPLYLNGILLWKYTDYHCLSRTNAELDREQSGMVI